MGSLPERVTRKWLVEQTTAQLLGFLMDFIEASNGVLPKCDVKAIDWISEIVHQRTGENPKDNTNYNKELWGIN